MKNRAFVAGLPYRKEGALPAGESRKAFPKTMVLREADGNRSAFYLFRSGIPAVGLSVDEDNVGLGGAARFLSAGLAESRREDDLVLTLSRAARLEEDFPGHARVVARYALLLAHTLGLTDEFFLRELERGAHLHDIGKAGIPRSILCKAGPLTFLEREIMKDHPLSGYALVRGLGLSRSAAQVILYHHERFDGRGYPFGLAGPQVPLAARILALADTLDAITSDRPYRPRSSFARARVEIRAAKGGSFDPDIVDAFLAVSDAYWKRVKLQTSPVLNIRLMNH
jgi:HD-GYP domain-containing protein (c-di-GMP phosphodiesterase class II)